MTKKQGLFRSLLLILLILTLDWVWKQQSKKDPVTPSIPQVLVQIPETMQLTDFVTQTGTMVAYNSVNLVARIEGFLNSVEFTDGSFVKKDKTLFLIQPDYYLEKLKEAQATVQAQKSAYDYAKSEYARQKRMYSQNATSLNNVEKWAAKTEEYQAEIDKAMANQAVAALNYSYTKVLAPFDGRMGRHLVDPGNLVGNGKATDLATIEQISPIYVYFNLNELDLLKIRAYIRANKLDPVKLNTIPVYVSLQNENGRLHEGKLDFVNTGLNASTGTLEFRAVLPNKDYLFLPGLFVKVQIPVSKPQSVLTVPGTAILYDQIGAYLLTVDKNNRVLMNRITTGPAEKGNRAILTGLAAQDRVIVDGLQNAIPGNTVRIVQNGVKKP